MPNKIPDSASIRKQNESGSSRGPVSWFCFFSMVTYTNIITEQIHRFDKNPGQ